MVKRGDVYWVNLDPAVGSEIKKTRPCLVISPDEMNKHLSTIIIAPMTTNLKRYPTRIAVEHDRLVTKSRGRIHSVDRTPVELDARANAITT
jgi:mRNA interferase MazF